MAPMKRKSNQNNYTPYKKKKSSKPYARISNGGVGGAAHEMVPRPMPPAQEVKTFNIDVNGVSPLNGGFTTMYSAAVNINACFLGGIVPGADPTQRIGRQIRVVGLVLRGIVACPNGTNPQEGVPYTIDMLWDKQPNGFIATPLTIYDQSPSASIINLPNANFVKRFSFVKRIQNTGRAGIPTARQIIDATIKTNKLVSYDNAAANANSVEQNSFLISWCSDVAASTFSGTLRIMYVDA